MKTLHAGPVIAAYENGFLRRIYYGESEVLRMIYFALRDRNWNTLESRIEDERIMSEEDHFLITYTCINLEDGIPIMKWNASIEGTAEGTISFEIRGTMLEAFTRNRAGFCILHPLKAAGVTCAITHPDGTETRPAFPVNIAPENPFIDIQSMLWDAGDATFRLDFEGDLFETEDQRNWGDASYKTFCTPLSRPFPVALKKGETVFQKVIMSPAKPLQPVFAASHHVALQSTGVKVSIPFFGIAASTEVTELSPQAIENVRALRLHHYRLDLYPATENWVSDFSSGYEAAHTLGLPLEAVLHLTANYKEELEAFSILCQQNKVRLKKVLLLSETKMVTEQQVVDALPDFKSAFPRVAFGAGTNHNFNEINKNRFEASNCDFISLSFDPQEHASDDLTILENSSTPEHIVNSTKALYGDRMSVHISPLTLRRRYNPYATNPDDFFIAEDKKADPRQRESLCATWAAGCICSLTRAGASAVTFFQTVGRQGVLSAHGDPYPVYDVLKMFAPYQGRTVTILASGDGLAIDGLLIEDKILALVNYTNGERAVRWNGQEFELKAREVKLIPLHRPQ